MWGLELLTQTQVDRTPKSLPTCNLAYMGEKPCPRPSTCHTVLEEQWITHWVDNE